MIGVTDKKPSINSGNPNLLDGWDSTILPWTDYTNGGAGVVGVGRQVYYQKMKFYLENPNST